MTILHFEDPELLVFTGRFRNWHCSAYAKLVSEHAGPSLTRAEAYQTLIANMWRKRELSVWSVDRTKKRLLGVATAYVVEGQGIVKIMATKKYRDRLLIKELLRQAATRWPQANWPGR